MPLHPVGDRTGELRLTATDATELAQRTLPARRIPYSGVPPHVASELVHAELVLDGSSRQNLATFCTTRVAPDVRQLMSECIDKNLIDNDEYPRTAEIESRCIHILADLWRAPEAESTIGCSTTGSSEAAMLGGLALKWRWRQKRVAAGLPADRPNLVCGPVQMCWKKFARYFDVELREIPLRAGASGMAPDQVGGYCDENTIGVVSTLGVTFTGAYEPVRAIAKALDALQDARGLDLPMHVDAASGGFVAPFVQPEIEWDFRNRRVKSINASGHKYGLAPLGVGWIVWRDISDLPDELVFRVDSLGGDVPTFGLTFTRPGSAIIAQYYSFIRHGREGYRALHQASVDTARYLADEVAAMGPFDMVYDGRGGLPAIAYALRDPASAGFSLYDLSDRLRMRGWQVASYPLPPDRRDTVVQRILIRHGVSRDMVITLADDIRRALTHFRRHPLPPSTQHRPSHHH